MQTDQQAGTRRLLYKGKVLDLGMETVTLPNGVRCELEIIRHPGGAVALALDEDDRVCLLRQYRHAAEGWIWELPGGRIEAAEDPLLSVQRELQEETGVTARQWTPLSRFFSTPGFCDECLHLFIARDLQPGEAAAEEDELLEIHWIPLQDAMDLCRRGEIIDAKTLVGLYQLYDSLKG